jgi:hypothetical protein
VWGRGWSLPHSCWKHTWYPLYRVGIRADLDRCGKSCLPTRVRPPDHPPHSKSHYWLCYAGPPLLYIVITKGLLQQIVLLNVGLKCHCFIDTAQGCKDGCLCTSYWQTNECLMNTDNLHTLHHVQYLKNIHCNIIVDYCFADNRICRWYSSLC